MDNLFRKYQKPLLQFANNKWGRKFLDLRVPQDKKIGLIFPNGVAYRTKRNEAIYHCYAGQDVIANKLGLALTAMDILDYRSVIDLLNYVKFPIKELAFTDYTPTAGDAQFVKSDATWATARGAATADGTDYTATTRYIYCDHSSNYRIVRLSFPVSTAAVLGTVTAATLNLYVFEKGTLNTLIYDLVAHAQVSMTESATSDYATFVLTDLGHLTWAEITAAQYNIWTLTDLTKIIVGGNTKLGIATNFDVANSAPVSVADDSFTGVNMSENATNKPYYTITAAGAGGGGGSFLINFI